MKKSKKLPQKALKTNAKKAKEANVPIISIGKAESKPKVTKTSFLKRENQLFVMVGLNPKKEWLIFSFSILIFLALGVTLSILMSNFYLLIPTFILALIYGYVFLDRPKSILKAKKENLRMEFVKLFSFLRVFLSNGHSVYSALSETRSYARGDSLDLFDKLIEGIDINKTIEPYLEFADAFDSIEIKQAMIATYELSLDGGKERFAHFDSVFQRISEEKRDEAFYLFKNKLANMNFFPLIGSAFSMGLVTIAVVTLMGNTNYGF